MIGKRTVRGDRPIKPAVRVMISRAVSTSGPGSGYAALPASSITSACRIAAITSSM